MLAIFQVQQGPQLGLPLHEDVAAPAAVATIRATLGSEFISVKMHGTATAFSGANENLDIIYKVRFCH